MRGPFSYPEGDFPPVEPERHQPAQQHVDDRGEKGSRWSAGEALHDMLPEPAPQADAVYADQIEDHLDKDGDDIEQNGIAAEDFKKAHAELAPGDIAPRHQPRQNREGDADREQDEARGP